MVKYSTEMLASGLFSDSVILGLVPAARYNAGITILSLWLRILRRCMSYGTEGSESVTGNITAEETGGFKVP